MPSDRRIGGAGDGGDWEKVVDLTTPILILGESYSSIFVSENSMLVPND